VIGAVACLAVVLVGLFAIARAIRATALEASRMSEEVRRMGELQPALGTVRHEAVRTAAAVKQIRYR